MTDRLRRRARFFIDGWNASEPNAEILLAYRTLSGERELWYHIAVTLGYGSNYLRSEYFQLVYAAKLYIQYMLDPTSEHFNRYLSYLVDRKRKTTMPRGSRMKEITRLANLAMLSSRLRPSHGGQIAHLALNPEQIHTTIKNNTKLKSILTYILTNPTPEQTKLRIYKQPLHYSIALQ